MNSSLTIYPAQLYGSGMKGTPASLSSTPQRFYVSCQHLSSTCRTTTTYTQDALGLIAASLRMINHNTLETPIKGPKRLAAVVVRRPATTTIYVPTSPSGARTPGSGAIMFAGYCCKAMSLSSARTDPISIRKSMKDNGDLIIVILEMSLRNLTSPLDTAIGSKKCGSVCTGFLAFFRCAQGCLRLGPSRM